MKNWKQSKTIWFNLLTFIFGMIPMINADILTALGVANIPLYMTLLSIFTAMGNFFLRFVTTTAIETK